MSRDSLAEDPLGMKSHDCKGFAATLWIWLARLGPGHQAGGGGGWWCPVLLIQALPVLLCSW